MINLTLLNGTGYVFDADDYMQLRSKHRIVGAMIGTCNARGWSSNTSSLPAELTQCETQILLEQGIAQLVSKEQSLLRTPTASALQEYQTNFKDRLAEQELVFKAEKLRETESNMDKIIAGKRKKLLRSGVLENEINLNPTEIIKEVADNFVFDSKNALLEIACNHPQQHTAKIVQFPADNSLKYRVFRDFWLRGKYVTAGDAFGADLLVYPGDPMLYHASHIIILLSEPKLKPLDLIAKVRLSVIVNKICVFAYFAEGSNRSSSELTTSNSRTQPEIHYQTVGWEGDRDKIIRGQS